MDTMAVCITIFAGVGLIYFAAFVIDGTLTKIRKELRKANRLARERGTEKRNP